MVRLELGRRLGKAYNDDIDCRGDQAKEAAAQYESDGRAQDKGRGNHGSVLFHRGCKNGTDDSRDDADADAHRQQHLVNEIIGNDQGPTSGLEQLSNARNKRLNKQTIKQTNN